MRKIFSLALASLLLFAATAFAGLPEEGLATYYAARFNHHKTASGERYNKNALTAAHRTLPFGTYVRVTNLRNHKSVVVRINDRGPVKKSRIIDLSTAAAKAIDMIRSGVVKVRLELASGEENGKSGNEAAKKKKESRKEKKPVARKHTGPAGGSFLLQAGAFTQYENAGKSLQALKKKGIKDVYIKKDRSRGQTVYKLVLGPYLSKNEAEEMRKRLKKQKVDAFIIKQ